MCIDEQRAVVDFGVSIPLTGNIDEGFLKAEKVCEDILPEKLKEVRLLVWHLKNTKDKIEKGNLNLSTKVENDV